MPVTHQFVSAASTVGSTATDVNVDDWNVDHWSTLTNSTKAFPEILQRSTKIGPTSNSSVAVVLSSYLVPARALGTDRILHCTLWGQITLGSTVTNGIRLEVAYNTSRWADLALNILAVQAIAPWCMETWVYHPTGTSGILAVAGRFIQSSGTAPTFGLGDISQAGAGRIGNMGIFGSSNISSGFTVTTGAASSFVIRANWQVANTSLSVTKLGGLIELL